MSPTYVLYTANDSDLAKGPPAGGESNTGGLADDRISGDPQNRTYHLQTDFHWTAIGSK